MQERFAVGGAAGPALMLLAFVIALAVARWLSRRFGAGSFGLQLSARAVPIILVGVAAMTAARLAVGAGAVALETAVYAPVDAPGVVASSFAVALLMGSIPALSEDILTRGFPLFVAKSCKPAWILILISATMYMLNHIWRFDWGLTEQLRLFCMGLAYAAAAWRLGTLWAAFGLHLGWNASSALIPLDVANVDAFRVETGAMHLVIAVFFFVMPVRRGQGS